MSSDYRIRVTKNLYFQLPKLKINLVAAVGEDSSSFALTIPEARMIFQSMKSALELNKREQIEFSEFIWTTDCRSQTDNPERITIHFKSPNESTQTVLQREELANILAEFEGKLWRQIQP
jgi:hypothetical protein